MNLDFSAEDRSFRDEIRTWLHENAPTERRPRMGAAMRQFDMEWLHKRWESGWAGISWPVEYGGRGLPLTQQLIWHEEYARLGLPDIDSSFVGINHAGPTLIARATDEQKRYHLPKILRGEVVWCQGFSEPEAGSDLASLRTRAVVDGQELVVSGHKIWTSFAEVDDGWSVAMSTLSFERGTAFTASQVALADGIERLIELAGRQPVPTGTGLAIDDAELARRLARLRAQAASLRAMTYASISRNARTPVPGPEGSMMKLHYSDLHQEFGRLSMDLLGPDGLALGPDAAVDWAHEYLRGFSTSIGGGTSEIQPRSTKASLPSWTSSTVPGPTSCSSPRPAVQR